MSSPEGFQPDEPAENQQSSPEEANNPEADRPEGSMTLGEFIQTEKAKAAGLDSVEKVRERLREIAEQDTSSTPLPPKPQAGLSREDMAAHFPDDMPLYADIEERFGKFSDTRLGIMDVLLHYPLSPESDGLVHDVPSLKAVSNDAPPAGWSKDDIVAFGTQLLDADDTSPDGQDKTDEES